MKEEPDKKNSTEDKETESKPTEKVDTDIRIRELEIECHAFEGKMFAEYIEEGKFEESVDKKVLADKDYIRKRREVEAHQGMTSAAATISNLMLQISHIKKSREKSDKKNFKKDIREATNLRHNQRHT